LGAFCSDAEDYGRGLPHPAAYGAFAKILSKFVRADGFISFEEAIRKMTSYPSRIFELEDRGTIRPGAFADLVLLDPRRITDRATFEKPRRKATGVNTVVINGRVAFSDGKLHQGFHGEVIRYKN